MPKSSARKRQARLLSSREVYHGPVFWVSTDHVLEPTGIRLRRDIVRHSGSGVVLAVKESSHNPQVLLEYQYRDAAQSLSWAHPAGRIDPGDSEFGAAKRELRVET